jgi:cohesin domain-containing protein/centrosomal CEP192-like protein/List-Bact-rpt repeat protein
MKIRTLILILLMLSCGVSAFAAPSIGIGNVSASPGQTVQIPITLTTNGALIVNPQIDLKYDNNLLSNPSIVLGAAGTGMTLASNLTYKPNVIRLSLYDNNNTPLTDGDLFIVSFTVSPSATNGVVINLSFETNPILAADATSYEEITVPGTNGAITITTPVVKGNITASATAFHFGNVTVGSSSSTQILTFTNSGPGSLTVSSAPTNGNDADFQIESGGPTPCPELPHTFASGEGCTLLVAFAPTTGGTRSATMSVISDAANSPTLNVSMDGTGQYSLTTVLTGSGSGSVNSTPAGIACGSGSCSASFNAATPVTLMATPANYSTFAGWTGGCSSIDANGNCVIAALNATTTITATFTLMPALVQLTGDTTPYQSLLGAYLAAADGAVLTARNMTFNEDLTLSQQTGLTIRGGRDAGFSSVNGYTYIHGILTVAKGKLTAEYLAVK